MSGVVRWYPSREAKEMHGDSVLVCSVEVVGDRRPLWAFRCSRCDEYGPIRSEYPRAVDDGTAHVAAVNVPRGTEERS